MLNRIVVPCAVVLLLSAAAFAQNNPDNQVYNNQSLQPFPDSGSTVFVMCGNSGCDPLGKLDLTSSSVGDSLPGPATDGPGVVGVNLVNDAPIGAGPMGTGFSGAGNAGWSGGVLWMGAKAFMNGVLPNEGAFLGRLLVGSAGMVAGSMPEPPGDPADTNPVMKTLRWKDKPWYQNGRMMGTNKDKIGNHYIDELVKLSRYRNPLQGPATTALKRWTEEGMELRVSIIKNKGLVKFFQDYAESSKQSKYMIEPEAEEFYSQSENGIYYK